jgi:ABC-type xylose transport system permease subunit
MTPATPPTDTAYEGEARAAAALDRTASEEAGGTWVENLQLFGLLGAILATVVIFAILTHGIFLTPGNLYDLGKQVAILGVAAAGVTCVLIMGEFDISTGGAVAFIASLLGLMLIRRIDITSSVAAAENMPGWIALPIGLAAAMAIALVNGFVITRLARSGFRTASFIVTLAGFLAYPALAIWVLPNAAAPTPSYIGSLGREAVPAIIGTPVIILAAAAGILSLIQSVRSGRRSRGAAVPGIVVIGVILVPLLLLSTSKGIPWMLVVCVAAVGVLEVVTQMTVFGRHAYAVGGNRQDARLSGVNVGRTIKIGFLIMGLVYFLDGVLYLARLDAASPLIGRGLELRSIAAAAIGGVSLAGGRGRPYQALLGAFVIVGLANGFNLMNLPTLWQDVVTGIVLVSAVWFDVAVRNRVNKVVVE